MGVISFFANYEINNNTGIEYLGNTCKAYGNYGNHFNQLVNEGDMILLVLILQMPYTMFQITYQ